VLAVARALCFAGSEVEAGRAAAVALLRRAAKRWHPAHPAIRLAVAELLLEAPEGGAAAAEEAGGHADAAHAAALKQRRRGLAPDEDEALGGDAGGAADGDGDGDGDGLGGDGAAAEVLARAARARLLAHPAGADDTSVRKDALRAAHAYPDNGLYTFF